MAEPQTKTFAAATAAALTAAAASPEPATTRSTSSDDAHKRHFLQTFRRWSILFKRKEASVEDDRWLLAEYYKSLGHLSEAGLDALTELLKENCTFFPTVKECLDATRCGRYDYGNPFLDASRGDPSPLLRSRAPSAIRLSAPVEQIEYRGDEY